ncbi:MAG: ACP S-malonyltransferase [Treponema sp.]|jgi:[acyl-carrier-protein] S-malonyltransferase|nr:ACP S-malonyltransferase [Treponema sp.]
MTGKKTVFLFPGQGAQYPGMALDLLETGSAKIRELFELASEIMGRDMAALLRDSAPETLKQSDKAQPAVTLANLSAAALLVERGFRPLACAGHSLGEYAALETAGIVSTADCFTLVKRRGAAMRRAAERLAGTGAGGTAQAAGMAQAASMAAVIGLSPDRVEALIAEWKAGENGPAMCELYAANFNSPRQTVVSGSAAALALAEERFKAAGARRVAALQVAGPFHSPLMAEAAEEFRSVLEAASFHDPLIPVYSNVTGSRIGSGAEAKKLALEQITRPVRWTAVEQALLETGPEIILEAGPGRVLQGLWKDSGSPLPCYPAGTVAEIDNLFEN